MRETKMTDKTLTKIEAQQIVKQKLVKHTECCGFVGDLNEVLEHAQKEHNVRGKMENSRLDGSVWNDEDDNSWISAKNVYRKENGNFWFVCLETHAHNWAKDLSDPKFPEARCTVKDCKAFSYTILENDTVGNFKTVENDKVAYCDICDQELTVEQLLVHLAEKHGRD
jgi:hypothetical protein